MPPHAGHVLVVRRALEHVDDLTVLVCSLTREPIPGSLRYGWMAELMAELSANVRVVHVTDENPSEPSDHPRFWEIWTATIRRAMPIAPDIVFTSALRCGARRPTRRPPHHGRCRTA